MNDSSFQVHLLQTNENNVRNRLRVVQFNREFQAANTRFIEMIVPCNVRGIILPLGKLVRVRGERERREGTAAVQLLKHIRSYVINFSRDKTRALNQPAVI